MILEVPKLCFDVNGHENRVTLNKGLRHLLSYRLSWLSIPKCVVEALSHVLKAGVLHNDLKSDNFVLEKRHHLCNPVIIDFGKARFITKPKPLVSLSTLVQERYKKFNRISQAK